MNSKICTSIEQSKKLLELGIDVNTADMVYQSIEDEYGDGEWESIPRNNSLNIGYDDDIPCWSLSALMNLLPSEFTEVGKYSTTTYKIDFRKYKFTDDVELYQIAYGSIKFDVDGQYSFKDMINTSQKEDPIDAAFEMVCWLKKEEYI